MELDEESSRLTTFITPVGRYRGKCLPFGISSAPEECQRRMIEALEGIEGVHICADDILISALATHMIKQKGIMKVRYVKYLGGA